MEMEISLPFKENFPSVEWVSNVFASLQNQPPGNITERQQSVTTAIQNS